MSPLEAPHFSRRAWDRYDPVSPVLSKMKGFFLASQNILGLFMFVFFIWKQIASCRSNGWLSAAPTDKTSSLLKQAAARSIRCVWIKTIEEQKKIRPFNGSGRGWGHSYRVTWCELKRKTEERTHTQKKNTARDLSLIAPRLILWPAIVSCCRWSSI